jgi:hypothetical protein
VRGISQSANGLLNALACFLGDIFFVIEDARNGGNRNPSGFGNIRYGDATIFTLGMSFSISHQEPSSDNDF